MKQFSYVITDKEGIHARPAGLFVKQAGKYSSKITIAKGEKSGDAKRIFAVIEELALSRRTKWAKRSPSPATAPTKQKPPLPWKHL